MRILPIHFFFFFRRLIRFAAEDVGLADPQALPQALAADQAVDAIGMPEAGVCIAQAVVYLALAPKSCAVYRAYNDAMKACREEAHAGVPMHIRNAPTKMMKGLGYSKGYKYNPSAGYSRGCEEGYLPAELSGRTFFDPHDVEPADSHARAPAVPLRWPQPAESLGV
ncbi:MgsA AAA+ ATPase C terminal-domain-containing protein [Pavlovales sp. CCMP2436]|nr:MgsA AAA+ ATPase C terminal-domain-containing protein [Pavlovales sp. CCMP2436]